MPHKQTSDSTPSSNSWRGVLISKAVMAYRPRGSSPYYHPSQWAPSDAIETPLPSELNGTGWMGPTGQACNCMLGQKMCNFFLCFISSVRVKALKSKCANSSSSLLPRKVIPLALEYVYANISKYINTGRTMHLSSNTCSGPSLECAEADLLSYRA